MEPTVFLFMQIRNALSVNATDECSKPVNVTGMPERTAIDKIFFAPFSQNFVILILAIYCFPLAQELISCSKYIDKSDMITLWTSKAFHCSFRLKVKAEKTRLLLLAIPRKCTMHPPVGNRSLTLREDKATCYYLRT